MYKQYKHFWTEMPMSTFRIRWHTNTLVSIMLLCCKCSIFVFFVYRRGALRFSKLAKLAMLM